MIAELDRDGQDTTAERQLLATFEELQNLHVEGRDRLRGKLRQACAKTGNPISAHRPLPDLAAPSLALPAPPDRWRPSRL
jgi:hypothetical protein